MTHSNVFIDVGVFKAISWGNIPMSGIYQFGNDKKITIDIIRLEEWKKGTIGTMLVNGESFCTTLELPWLNNKRNVSCIPTGTYECYRVYSELVYKISKGKHKETFEIGDVPNRTYCRFHAGNTPKDTGGCVLLGQYPGKLKEGERAILNSGNTFSRFMERLEMYDSFLLRVMLIRL